MSDTPRTDAAEKHAYQFKDEWTPVCESKLVRQLERELNAAQQRIQRLEEAGDAMDKTAEPFVLDTIDEDSDDGPIPMSDVGEQYEITYDSPPTAGDHVAMDRARKQWRKAKEAKP